MFIPICFLCLAKMSRYSTRISSIDCFSISFSSVSVQSNLSRFFSGFCVVFWIQFFFLFQFIQFFVDSCLYRGMVFNFIWNFGCRESKCVTLLFWFVRSEKFTQVSNEVRITFGNHTEKCHIHMFNELGLFWSYHGKFGNLFVFFSKQAVSVVLVFLNATFSSNIIVIE